MKKTFVFCILFFLLGSVFILQPTSYQILKLKTFDAFVKEQKPSGYFTVLNITEDDVRVSFAIMSLSSLIITSEGGVHHFAAAIGKPALVLYGGAIHPDQTGYVDRDQTYYVYDDPKTPCGSQVACKHCKEAMAAIDPQMVFEDALEIINEAR